MSTCWKLDEWHNADEVDPPHSSWPKRYLVVLRSDARALHCSRFAGAGEPEVCCWCSDYEYPGWNPRGDLTVAFWRPLPEFPLEWVPGEPGDWRPKR